MENFTENDAGGGGMRWIVAITASIAVHAAVLALFVAPGCGGEDGSDSAPAPSSAAQTAEAQPREGDSAGEERAYSPPSVLSPEPGGGGAAANRRPARPAAEAPGPGGASPAASIPEYYVVKQGDNLTKIARAYGTAAQDIAKANGKSLNAMNKLWVGQKIKLR